jgi:hypothetical protein
LRGGFKLDKKSILPEIAFYSLWRPDSLPNKNATLIAVKILSIGSITEITKRLMSIKHMKMMLKLHPGKLPIMRLLWDVGEGVILQYKAELGLEQLDVAMIEIISAVNNKTFYNLYIQIHENLGIILLDEVSNVFVPPREFKASLTR